MFSPALKHRPNSPDLDRFRWKDGHELHSPQTLNILESMFFRVCLSMFRLLVRENPSLIVTCASLLRVAEYGQVKELLFAVSYGLVI